MIERIESKLGAILGLILIISFACIPNPETLPEYRNAETQSRGIIVHGYKTNGRIQNISDKTIRVEYAINANQAKATQWIEDLPPGYTKAMGIEQNSCFYLYNESGGLIGFIRPTKNGAKR